jgi:MFS transporter, MHS family, proline/betaine transporter
MHSSSSSKAGAVAAVLGNAMEWYDFTVFAVMTPIISKLFFPVSASTPGSELNAVLLTTALFGAGFFMRPVGGVVLGLYGDRRGRKSAMMLGMFIMAVSVLLITIAPTYQSAGVLAPLIVLVARLLQGFSVGGEFGTSTAFLIELAPPGRSGFFGSWQITGQLMAQVLGSALGLLVTHLFTPAEQAAGAWRIPFAVGLVIVPIALYMRSNVMESEVFAKVREDARTRARKMAVELKQPGVKYLIGMGMVVASAVSFYVTFGYTVTYAKEVLKLPISQSFMVQMIAAIVMLIVVPLAGAASDSYDRKRLLLWSLGAYLVTLYPLYTWVTAAPSIERLLVTQIVAGVFSATFLGVYCSTLAELFPVRVRSTSLAIVNNVAVLVFGGFAQFFVTWLIKLTGSPLSPVFYVMIGLTLGFVSVVFLKREPRAEAAPSSLGTLGSSSGNH